MIDNSQGRCLGVLDVESGKADDFDEYDQEMMRLLAELAVIGMQSLQRYKDLQQTMTKATARGIIAKVGMSGSHWRHQIHGDAILINDHVTAIRNALDHPSLRKIKTNLERIERHANRISKGYDTTGPSMNKAIPQLVNAMLKDRLDNPDYAPILHKSVEVDYRFALAEEAQVKVERKWFFTTLDFLLENANHAMEDSVVKRLTIATREEQGAVVIEITDTGKGIPESALPKLFVEQLKDEDSASSLGVGLLMAREIIETYGGQVMPGRSDLMGTTMVILLPLC